jgi:DNA polymerase III delta prime subunit
MITADKNWVHPVAIKNLDEAGFKKILKENLTPARAISTPEHLKGRAQNLKQIDRAFNSPGKHIFIYGDRGVGKTSLALTAAFLHQSADGEPILLTCGATPFLQTIRDAVRRVLPPGGRINQKTTESRFKAAIGNVGYDRAFNITNGDVPPIETINDAVQLLKFAGEVHSSEPVIIFDEFDQLIDDDQKKCCAEIIKQVSDQGLNVRFIFCGIGNSLENLIGVHLSTGRYLSPIQLERLSHDARW